MKPSEVGNFIRKLRNENNMSQKELAEKLYLSRQAISRWENGHNIPDSGTLVLLGDLFHVSTDELLLGKRLEEQERLSEVSNFALIMADKTNKMNKLLKISITIIIILLITFLAYYFINSYNSLKVYTLNGESENFIMNNGIFVTTKGKIYFRLGNLQYDKNIEIDKVTLFYKENDENIVIYSGDSSDILLIDYYGYDAYFQSNKMGSILENLYLEINYDGTSEEMKINVVKDFANNSLLFRKSQKSSIPLKGNIAEKASIDDKDLFLSTDKMDCELGSCELMLHKGEEMINFSYFLEGQILRVEKLENENLTEWILYQKENVLDYRVYSKGKEMEKLSISLNDQNDYSDEEFEILKNFKENYLLKYLNE